MSLLERNGEEVNLEVAEEVRNRLSGITDKPQTINGDQLKYSAQNYISFSLAQSLHVTELRLIVLDRPGGWVYLIGNIVEFNQVSWCN